MTYNKKLLILIFVILDIGYSIAQTNMDSPTDESEVDCSVLPDLPERIACELKKSDPKIPVLPIAPIGPIPEIYVTPPNEPEDQTSIPPIGEPPSLAPTQPRIRL